MRDRKRFPSILIATVGLGGFLGCTPAAKVPPPPQSPKWTLENPLSLSAGSAGRESKGGTSPRESELAGSLEQARRGESTATPASSPLQEIYFDFDRYDIRPDAEETLKRNAEWLKKKPSARVQIEGHADERGTNEYNLALGSKRAQSAKNHLVRLGIEGERLSIISYGEELPVCREATEGCWAKNRRGRFVILDSGVRGP